MSKRAPIIFTLETMLLNSAGLGRNASVLHEGVFVLCGWWCAFAMNQMLAFLHPESQHMGYDS